MQGLITTSSLAEKQNFAFSLFDSFINYIDRGPQTTRAYITNFKQFIAWTRYKGITQPQRQDLIDYKNYLLAPHEAIALDPENPAGWKYRTDSAGDPITITCKPTTAAQYLRIVCMFFKWAASEGLYTNIGENIHAPKVRSDRHSKDALKPADVLKIERSIKSTASIKSIRATESTKDTAGRIQRSDEQGKRLFAMYLLAVNCGLRTIELSRAKVKDLELKDGQAILYVYGKGHTEADTPKPLAPEVYAAIKEYLDSRADKWNKDSFLFVSTGNRSKGRQIATTTISTMLKRAMQAAGYDSERLTAHSLRHTAGTSVQDLTENIYLTQQYMRHSNPATTEIYLHTESDRQQADIANRLYDYYHAGEQAQAMA